MLCKRWIRGNCLILSLTIFLLCFPLSVIAEEKSPDCYSATDTLEYEISASVVSVWDSHANLEYVVTNTGSETIHNWYYTFDLPYSIEGIWGALVFETDSGVCTIKNAGWNQDILPGNSVTFGMTVASIDATPILELPTYYLLNTKKALVDSSDYCVSYQEYSNWGTGFNGALLIMNESLDTIEDWELHFSWGHTITEVAGAYLAFEDDLYTISNNGSNQNLMPYSTTSLTVVGSCNGVSSGLLLENLELYSVRYAFGLTEDRDQNGIADYIDYMNGQSGDPVITPAPTVTPVPSITPTDTPEPTLTSTPAPTPEPELDSDGDGIPDSVEVELGTDPNSPDSDNDGVNDSVETMIGLDPLSDDSDGDGLPDGREDDDGDNLTLLEEIEYGTYTWTGDSDVDGIMDGDEVYIYGTDPLNEDTDGDTIEDGDELILGTNPLIPDSDGDGVPDGEERFLQTREEIINNTVRPEVNKVEVTLEGTGCLDSVMSIEEVYDKDKYSSELVGLVGVPVEIEYEGTFDEATLTFHYDQTLLSVTSTNIPEEFPLEDNYVTRPQTLGIFYYDEETGFYVDCEAEVDVSTQTVSCTTTHFSTYMLVDRAIWYYFWTSMKYSGEMRPSHEGYSGIDYVLEIPCVRTMTEADIAEMNEIAFRIIDGMQPSDRMVVRGYNTGGSYVYSFTNDKDLLKRQVGEWPWNEKDYWVGYNFASPDILDDSLDALEIFNVASTSADPQSNNELVVIAFNNSTDIQAYFFSADHRQKTEMTAYIFTLSSGDSQTTALRWLRLASGGGVIDCEGKTSEEVYAEFASLYGRRQGTDKDEGIGDGLWDIYEEQGMLGSNGRIYYSDPTRIDTDENVIDGSDGLSDKEEIGHCVVIEVTEDNELFVNGEHISEEPESQSILFDLPWTKWKEYQSFLDYGEGVWTIYCVNSDPQMVDTDYDEANDGEDATPRKKNGEINYILIGKDNGDGSLESMRKPYIKAFKEKGKKVVVLDIWDGSDFDIKVEKYEQKAQTPHDLAVFAFEHLNWNLDKEKLKGKIAYKNVGICVIISHGAFSNVDFQFSPSLTGQLDVVSVARKEVDIACPINILDIQACNTARDSYEANYLKRETCIAREFIKDDLISSVYAWSGQCIYSSSGMPTLGTVINVPYGYNYSPRYTKEYGYYVKFTKNVQGDVESTTLYDMSLPLVYD